MAALSLPRIIGHRGAAATAPENTLGGIRQAKREGAAWVEFDVKLSADGQAILMHDDTLDRSTTGTGPVRAMTLDQIRTLDAGAWFGAAWTGERVPTLAEVLTLLLELGMGFNLEIKPCRGREEETARTAVAEVRRAWPADRPAPVISSFSPIALAAAKSAAPALARGYLVERLSPTWRSEVERLGCSVVHLGWRGLGRSEVQAVKAAGLPLVVWTVNERPRGEELLRWGADSLISDCPGRLAGL
jgi:glycerophosphoryl diester phosphodiesterase